MSLSARRAWIEIFRTFALGGWGRGSLSARRAWIEMMIRIDEIPNQRRRSPQGERG